MPPPSLRGTTPRCGVSGPRPDMHDDLHVEQDEEAVMRGHVISLNRQLREKEALLAGLSESDDAVQLRVLQSAILELKVLLREATAVQQAKHGEPHALTTLTFCLQRLLFASLVVASS